MSNAIGWVVGAVLFAAGGSVGWWIKPAEHVSPSVAGGSEPDVAPALARELAELRTVVRDLAAQRALSASSETVERTPAVRRLSAQSDLDALVRELDERLSRAEREYAKPKFHDPAPFGAPRAGFESIEAIARLWTDAEARSVQEDSTKALVDLRTRLRSAYYFWSIDELLARHGLPHNASGYTAGGGMTVGYHLDEDHDVKFTILEEHVVDASL